MGFRLDDSDFQDELHSISVEIRNNLNIQVGLDLEYADIVYMQRILFHINSQTIRLVVKEASYL